MALPSFSGIDSILQRPPVSPFPGAFPSSIGIGMFLLSLVRFLSPASSLAKGRLVCGLLFSSAALMAGAASEAKPQAETLIHFNRAFIASVQAETPPPALTARNLAIFHAAIAEAAHAAERQGLPVELALGSAGQAAGSGLFPARSPEFAAELKRVLPRTAGGGEEAIQLGQKIAAAWLSSRAGDGCSTTVHYVPDETPGKWRRTPPAKRPPELPHWGSVKPFVVTRITDYRAAAPPALDSERYRLALEEVRHFGAKGPDQRNEDQTLAARFWSDFSYTPGPPGHWNEIACGIIASRNMELLPAATLLARMNVAMANAGIACWETKYHYNAWRPCTAIQRAGEDQRPETAADPAWESMLPCPPHPEYPSGHASFSGAAATILAQTLGGDSIDFEVTSVSVPGVIRKYASLNACAREIAASRVWGGIHFSYAGEAGLELGRKLAEATPKDLPAVFAANPD